MVGSVRKSMKKRFKIDWRMILALCLFLCAGIYLCMSQEITDIGYEENIYSRYQDKKEYLTLKSNVIVVNLPAISDDGLTASEKIEKDEEQMAQVHYLIANHMSQAKRIFFLGTDVLSQASEERPYISQFREKKNIFWHFNMKNIGYYHEEDMCGQVKFLDQPYGGENRFEVMGQGKYDKNFVPYFFMTMDGGEVSYDRKKQVYHVSDRSGRVSRLYALEDGTVRTRKTDKYDVRYYDLNSLYQMARNEKNPGEKFRDAVVLIQNDKPAASYHELGSPSQSLADYYIDVLGTIENRATVRNLSVAEKTVFVCLGILILGLAIMFCSAWLAVFVYLLEFGLSVLANMFLFQYNVCYVPITTFLCMITLTCVMMLGLKKVMKHINVKNLPIDAVIRFTNNIVNIEQSVSYAEYLTKNRSEIEDDISAVLLLPVMDKDSFLLKQLAEENHRNKNFVEQEFWNPEADSTSVTQTKSGLFQGVKFIAFVPLPVFDVESEVVTYTVIGLRKKLKPQNASYISMMLFSMYIYFKAQHERGEHQRMYFAMLSLMISVIDAKDPITAGHSQRVASISKDIGIWMKLSKSQQFDLEFTALLHDIGKIGVSDYVLNKQSVYTQEDFEQMKYHTIRGAEMLAEVGISEEIIDGVRHHHERMDGKGYPDGLKGDELNLFAKIIKIADVFDALTSKRQYKDAWGIEKALNIICRGRGTEFDAEIADVFIQHMSPPGWIPPVEEGRNGKKRDPFAKKTGEIVKDFYGRYNNYISVEYPIPSKRAKCVDFGFRNGFMGYDWGETFNNAQFLEEKPMILAYEKDTKSLIFGQGSKDERVQGIYYYFFKGFVNMGVYLLASYKVKDVLAKLEEAYGEPQVLNDQMILYPAQKMRIVFYRTEEDKCLLFYISDYMCSNYIFEEEKEDEL